MDRHAVQQRPNSLQIRLFYEGEDLYCHFDRSGRFIRATGRQRTIRRGLDNRLLEVTIADAPDPVETRWFGRPRHYHDLAGPSRDAFFAFVREQALAELASVSGDDPGDEGWMERIGYWTPERLAEDEAAFQAVYKPISILPPNEYKSLVVQFAEGCSYNECLFCDFYRDRRFHVKNPIQLQQHLDDLKQFMGVRIADRTGIFLGDGNALVVSADRLLPAMAQIRAAFPEIADSFATFMDTFNLDRKTPDALRRVREAGLQQVYVGLESGHNPLREFLLKPGTGDEARWAIRTLKQAGFSVGPIVMVGVGDRRMKDDHFRDTVKLLQEADLTADDTVFLSPFVRPRHDFYDAAVASGDVLAYSEEEIAEEMIRWKTALSSTLAAKVTGYYVREHIY